MSRAWMPLYVADYLADTAHLDATESGAYLHLIMHYWQTGGLPDDERKLAQIAKISAHKWKKYSSTLQKFFHDGWKHKRIDSELAKASEISEKRRSAAAVRHGKDDANAPACAEQLHTQSQSPSPVEEEGSEPKGSAQAAPGAPVMFGLRPAEPIYTDSTHELWAEGVAILGQLGVHDRSARTNIGRWLKAAEAAAVLNAIQRARDARTGDPIPFVTGALRTPGRGPPQRNASFQDVIRELSEGAPHDPEPTFDLDLTAEPDPRV
jgi:uncharacterized protein YdaU (DUF1376 family)